MPPTNQPTYQPTDPPSHTPPQDAPEGRREARRREREEAREAERLGREAKAGRVNRYEEARKKKDEEREAAERAQEDEIRRIAEERQRREDAEAAKWMGQISVDAAGVDNEGGADGGEAATARFVAYIQDRKMVSIEEVGYGRGEEHLHWIHCMHSLTPTHPLHPHPRSPTATATATTATNPPTTQLATEFRIRSAEVVERLTALEAQGQLTGVMDERGKFIHISADEMKAVADFMRWRGRVAIAELAAKSGGLGGFLCVVSQAGGVSKSLQLGRCVNPLHRAVGTYPSYCPTHPDPPRPPRRLYRLGTPQRGGHLGGGERRGRPAGL
jgi:hypothetical protein